MPLRIFRRNMPPTLTAGLEILQSVLHSDATRDYYAICVKILTAAIGDVPLSDVTIDDLRQWSVSLDSTEYSEWTKHSYRRGVRAFFNHMVDLGHLAADQNPADQFRFPSPPSPEPKHLQPDEVEALLYHAGNDVRDYALMRILYDTGCRISDMASMTMPGVVIQARPAFDHLSGDERQLAELANEMDLLHMLSEEYHAKYEGKILVLGKGQQGKKKHRWVFFGHETAVALRDYIETRPANAGKPLWLTKKGQPLKRDSFYWIFKQIAKRAGVQASPHDMRHTFAYRLIRNGADAKMVQRLLGHSALNTTMNYYYNFTEDELWEVHRQFSE